MKTLYPLELQNPCTRLWLLVGMLSGGIRYSGKANNQIENKIEITRFTSITVWGSDRVRHNCASNKVTNEYWTIFYSHWQPF